MVAGPTRQNPGRRLVGPAFGASGRAAVSNRDDAFETNPRTARPQADPQRQGAPSFVSLCGQRSRVRGSALAQRVSIEGEAGLCGG